MHSWPTPRRKIPPGGQPTGSPKRLINPAILPVGMIAKMRIAAAILGQVWIRSAQTMFATRSFQTQLSPGNRSLTRDATPQVSEASVKAAQGPGDLITSPAFIVIKAADEFRDKTSAPNQLWQTDLTYFKHQSSPGTKAPCAAALSRSSPLGLVLSVDHSGFAWKLGAPPRRQATMSGNTEAGAGSIRLQSRSIVRPIYPAIWLNGSREYRIWR